MTLLYIFTYASLFHDDLKPDPRPRPGVLNWFKAWQNGHIEAAVAVIWPRPDVGRRYALKRAGVPVERLAGMAHEAKAEAAAAGLADKLGLSKDKIFLSFNWVNYTDYRLDQGPAPLPEARENDPRWSDAWRFPEPGAVMAALKAAAVVPGASLMVYNYHAEELAADRLFLPKIHAPRFFLLWPDHTRHISQRRVKRQSLDDFIGRRDD